MGQRCVLLLGESNVGKTHYGAQVLRRLIVGQSSLKMHGQAKNLDPFEHAMASLSDGRSTGHTPANVYVESSWPVIDGKGTQAELIWPDYGGEQIKSLIADHQIPTAWRDRVATATDWVLLIRLHTLQNEADIFSRPLTDLAKSDVETKPHKPSDQARLIELLQILLNAAAVDREVPLQLPTLTVLLSCWDEVEDTASPGEALKANLPLICDFIESVWDKPTIVGLSALERTLSEEQPDEDYATRGPETFGYIVKPDGTTDSDITWPISRLLLSP